MNSRFFIKHTAPFFKRVLVSIDSRLQGIAPSTPIDAATSPTTFQPLDLRYPARFPCLVRIPLSRGIGLDIFALDGTTHPFVRALSTQDGSAPTFSFVRRRLAEYYDNVRDINAHDWLGLTVSKSVFQQHISWARCYPWHAGIPEGQRKAIVNNALYDAKNAGRVLDISHGWKTIGPISEELLALEALRLHRLFQTIQTDGFKLERPGKAVSALILYSTRHQWRWIASGAGQHRVAVAAALKLPYIPVYVENVICREEVESWPQVRTGRITKNDALLIFDRLMSDELPPALQHWRNYSSS